MHTIAFDHLVKRYGSVTAVDGFTVEVHPGRVTAFLGANGSGKTTSLRSLVGLTTPTSGSATVDGRAYRDLANPTRIIGAVLDQGVHPNRTARAHLRIAALLAGVPQQRADDLLETVGLAGAGHRRAGGFSLGMRQRLALAAALVGNPGVLVLDEPFNGLDPAGIRWLRTFLKNFADAGGTVFLSTHLLAEVAQSADDVVVIDRGRLVVAGPVSEVAHGGDLETAFESLVSPLEVAP